MEEKENVIPLKRPPCKSDAQSIIRELTAAGKVIFHPHTRKRAQITHMQVLNCLKTGSVDENPTQNLSHKGWSTAVVGRAAGEYLRVVVCMRWEQQDLLVVTAYDC